VPQYPPTCSAGPLKSVQSALATQKAWSRLARPFPSLSCIRGLKAFECAGRFGFVHPVTPRVHIWAMFGFVFAHPVQQQAESLCRIDARSHVCQCCKQYLNAAPELQERAVCLQPLTVFEHCQAYHNHALPVGHKYSSCNLNLPACRAGRALWRWSHPYGCMHALLCSVEATEVLSAASRHYNTHRLATAAQAAR
jgi:hypothetical protein